MIQPRPLVEAQTLIVGTGDLVDEILENLASHDVRNVTVMHTSSPRDEKLCHFVQKDPSDLITQDSDYFKKFDLVLAANQPRAFELALSDLRWPDDGDDSNPDLPMIVMRSAANACKMRCQYRERLVDRTKTSKFVKLTMDLLPWTDEKRELVASIVKDEFKPDENPRFRTYLTAALAVIKFQQSNGSWPKNQDKEQVSSIATHLGSGFAGKNEDLIEQFCEGGLGAVHETIVLLGRVVALEAVKLLTDKGQTINNVNLEEVIQIAAQI